MIRFPLNVLRLNSFRPRRSAPNPLPVMQPVEPRTLMAGDFGLAAIEDTASDGRRSKPLFAFYVEDLDAPPTLSLKA